MRLTRQDVNGLVLWQGRHLTKSGTLLLHVAESLSDVLDGLYMRAIELTNEKEGKQ